MTVQTRVAGVQKLVLAADAAAIAALVVLSLFVCRHLLGAINSSFPNSGYSGDVGQGIWYMAWLPFALGHGLTPFVSHYQFAPNGFNLLSNTGDLFPALLLSPVTVIFGPIAAFNIGVISAPVISGSSLYFVSRRLGQRQFASFVAATLFGFSPYLMHESEFGHFNLTWLFFPPLAYYLARRIVLGEGRSFRCGLVLGALVVVQFFTSTEILFDCVVIAVPMCAIYVTSHWRDARRVAGHLAEGIGGILLLTAPLLAYPFFIAFSGPYHVLPLQQINYGIAVTSPAWPSATPLLPTGFFGHADSGFVGPGALVASVAALWWWRRVREVSHFATGAVLAYVFALGPVIRTSDTTLADTSPMAWLNHLRLFQAIMDYRFSALMIMFVALLCAVTITEISQIIPSPAGASRLFRLGAFATVGSGVLLLPLLAANLPETSDHVVFPAAAIGAADKGVDHPALATYPEVGLFAGAPLLWQAVSGMQFRLTGGYAFVAGGNGSILAAPPSDSVDRVFGAALSGHLPARISKHVLSSVRSTLADRGTTGVVVSLETPGGRLVEHDLRLILGVPSFLSSDFAAWNHG